MTRSKEDSLALHNAEADFDATPHFPSSSARSVPMMFGSCLALGTLMGTFRAAGDSLTGPYKEGLPLAAGGGDENQPDWRELRKERRNAFFKVSLERRMEDEDQRGRERGAS